MRAPPQWADAPIDLRCPRLSPYVAVHNAFDKSGQGEPPLLTRKLLKKRAEAKAGRETAPKQRRSALLCDAA
jgi:hypothetical protein